jgi:hypothetical protein
MYQLQRSWVRSQHPSAQWNLRGGRWSSVEYSTKKNKKKYPKNIFKKRSSVYCSLSQQRFTWKPAVRVISSWTDGNRAPYPRLLSYTVTTPQRLTHLTPSSVDRKGHLSPSLHPISFFLCICYVFWFEAYNLRCSDFEFFSHFSRC